MDDMASACKIQNLEMEKYKKITGPEISHVNVGFGKDITILNCLHQSLKLLVSKNKSDLT